MMPPHPPFHAAHKPLTHTIRRSPLVARLQSPPCHNLHPQYRTFLPSPFPSPHSNTPERHTSSLTLPYPPAPIYTIIADIPAYATFLPYCTRSTITAWSAPDRATGRRWPSEGVLGTGWGGIVEEFESRVFCVPGRVVQSVAGDARCSLADEDVRHHLEGRGEGNGLGAVRAERESGQRVLTYLRNTWRLEPVRSEETRVSLDLEYVFANPLYAALSKGAVPKVAEAMVRAFEKRVEEVVKRVPGLLGADLGEMEGSRLRRNEK